MVQFYSLFVPLRGLFRYVHCHVQLQPRHVITEVYAHSEILKLAIAHCLALCGGLSRDSRVATCYWTTFRLALHNGGLMLPSLLWNIKYGGSRALLLPELSSSTSIPRRLGGRY